jgi:ribosomal protein S12 methylthiotransferase accessory factor
MRRVASGWLVAALPDALVCQSSAREIRIGLELTPDRGEALVQLVHTGVAAQSLASLLEISEADAAQLVHELAGQGALTESEAAPSPRDGVPLVDAVLDSLARDATYPLVWTATEALKLPSEIDARAFRRTLLAFIAGMEDDTRLAAYCQVASTRRRTVCGDSPSPDRLETALAQGNGFEGAVAVLPLDVPSAGPGTYISLARLERAGEVPYHRLAPVLGLVPDPGPQPRPGQGFTCGALYALPNLRHPHAAADRWAHGSGRSPDQARLVARAEALERYATGDPSEHLVVRAREADLEGAIPPTLQHELTARQYAEHPDWSPYAPGDAYLWTPAHTVAGGGRRWVLAESAFFPFHDPQRSHRTVYASSSGVAAHSDYGRAADAAFLELIERDAFMWTWVQRVSRERIRHRSLPADLRRAVTEIEGGGLAVELINLTLELEIVFLCVVHGPEALHLGACCYPDPVRAAAKAIDEAAMTLDIEPAPRLDETEVAAPLDHHRFYQQPDRIGEAAFLWASSKFVDLRDLPTFEGPLHERLTGVGEPLVVDLSSSRTRPLRVVRAIVPGLIPISFGWDIEPLGMARLRHPKDLSGRILGRSLPSPGGQPILPHPFA